MGDDGIMKLLKKVIEWAGIDDLTEEEMNDLLHDYYCNQYEQFYGGYL